MIPSKTTRFVSSIFVGVLSIFLVLAPLYVKPEITQLQRKYNRNRVPERFATDPDPYHIKMNYNEVKSTDNSSIPQKEKLSIESPSPAQEIVDKETVDSHRHHYNQVDINGTMTLNEISRKFNVSIDELAKVINVPVDYANERLGRLKRRYGFEIDDLRVFVLNNSGKNDK